MAQFISPNTITNGLVFYYDMSSIKSYCGQPTTNLVSNASTMSSFSNYSNGPATTFTTEFGTIGWRMTSAGSWNGCYQTISIPSSGTYTFSAWYRYWGGSNNNNGATCYVSGWGGGDSATTIDKSKIGVWQRISITLNVTTSSCTLYLISYGGTNGADNSTWDVTMPQCEAGSYPTTFISGTRSNTQALVDLTGNNTVTASSLTYNSDGTFSFNGSGNYIDINNNALISGTNPYTIDAWYTRVSGSGAIFGNYGSGYTSNTIWVFAGGLYFNGSYYISNYGSRIAGTHNICVTKNSYGAINVYFDGNLEVSSTNTSAVSTSQNYRIGADVNGAGEPFNGNIYSVKVYNRELSSAEVLQNFNALRGRFGL